MLFSRQIRTRDPIHPFDLSATTYKDFYARQGSKQLPQLKEGDIAKFKRQSDKQLSPAVVIGQYETPRSHMINNETDRKYIVETDFILNLTSS